MGTRSSMLRKAYGNSSLSAPPNISTYLLDYICILLTLIMFNLDYNNLCIIINKWVEDHLKPSFRTCLNKTTKLNSRLSTTITLLENPYLLLTKLKCTVINFTLPSRSLSRESNSYTWTKLLTLVTPKSTWHLTSPTTSKSNSAEIAYMESTSEVSKTCLKTPATLINLDLWTAITLLETISLVLWTVSRTTLIKPSKIMLLLSKRWRPMSSMLNSSEDSILYLNALSLLISLFNQIIN